jgi:hypothetical protein
MVAPAPTSAKWPFRTVTVRVEMLGPGDRIPDVSVWTSPREEAHPLRDVLGSGLSLLLFYLYDWSPT